MSRCPALLNLLGLLIAVSCIGCGGGSPAEPAPSIAIECHNLALCPLDDFLCNEPPITVGDPVSCSISLRHVRSDEDRPDTPPRVFGQAEWAFLSDDLGVLHPSPAKPITGWFGGGLTNIAPEEDDSQRANTCRGANNARLASPVDLDQCDSVCCETYRGFDVRFELLSRSACNARGTQRSLGVCVPELSSGCCHFYDSEDGWSFEVVSRLECESRVHGIAIPDWDNNVNQCACCSIGGELEVHRYNVEAHYNGDEQRCEIRGGELVATEDCVEGGFSACGFDDVCSVGYCEDGGGARVSREDDCELPVKMRHGNEVLVCCEERATEDSFLVGAPVDLTKRRWRGTTAYTFTALAAGNVTVMMRQTLNRPIAFVEASPGSSRVAVRIHPVRPQACRIDANCTDDANACTRERCVNRLCEHQPLGEGASCYIDATCATGTCRGSALTGRRKRAAGGGPAAARRRPRGAAAAGRRVEVAVGEFVRSAPSLAGHLVVSGRQRAGLSARPGFVQSRRRVNCCPGGGRGGRGRRRARR